jgi:carbon monoxide dehydrogenase subunit G
VKITGSYTVDAPRQAFWDALQDPAVLARTLPGCESLETTGEDAYAATLTAGVASIKGTYSGTVQLRDKEPPTSYRLTAEGSGAPGTIQADAVVRLEVDGDTTIVHYDADAVVGGMIGGVGQRMIAGAARKTAGEFFTAVAHEALHGPPEAVPAGGITPGAREAPTPEEGQVFAGAPTAASGGWFNYAPAGRGYEVFGAFALGAAVALVGVIVGRRTARRPA